MARQLLAAKELDDMTECSICTEVFTDPRGLPCYHTFCLKCLLNYGEDKQPGDSMACQMCRKMFTIPSGGLSGLQKNFCMEKLLRVRKLSAEEEARHIPSEGQLNQHFSVFTYGMNTRLLIKISAQLVYVPAYLGVLHLKQEIRYV